MSKVNWKAEIGGMGGGGDLPRKHNCSISLTLLQRPTIWSILRTLSSKLSIIANRNCLIKKIKDRLLSILGIRAILLPVLHLRLRQLLSRDFRRSLLPLQRSLISFRNLQLKTEFRDWSIIFIERYFEKAIPYRNVISICKWFLLIFASFILKPHSNNSWG